MAGFCCCGNKTAITEREGGLVEWYALRGRNSDFSRAVSSTNTCSMAGPAPLRRAGLAMVISPGDNRGVRLLIVEDDDHVASALVTALDRHGFEPTRARTGAEALAALPTGPDMVLLDLGLPDANGFELCQVIREQYHLPILVLTARTETRARIHGLNLGADDYMVKPYDLGELVARIHAIARRIQPRPDQPAREGPIEAGEVRIDPAAREVTVAGEPVELTRKEFELLAMLARQPGVVFRREHILSEVWRTHWQASQRSLEVHVASLRAKLGAPGLIETVRGVGYRLRS
jgi:DNA-binding response OmpR family regulator